MISDSKPDNFESKFEVVSCFIEYNNKILLLKRQDNKPQSNTYGLPAGKVNNGENKLEAIIREVREETGINLLENNVNFYKTKYVEYPDYKFTYHMFNSVLDEMTNVKININEHKEYIWETPANSLKYNLIQNEDHCIKDYYNI